MKDNNLYKLIVLIIMGIIVFTLIHNFIPGIISAFVISLFLLPLFRYLSKKMPKRVASLSIIIFIILCLFTIIYLISSEIVRQASQYLTPQSVKDTLGTFFSYIPARFPMFENFIDAFSAKIHEVLTALAIAFVTNIPIIAINVLLTLFLTYYLLNYWDEVSAFIYDILPITNKNTLTRIKDSFYKIFYGLTVIAIIEFFIALLGFYIAGVKLYLFLALIIAIAAFIPFFGPVTVWLPLFIYYIVKDNTYAAIVVLITGLILTIGIENLLSHIILGRRANINPAFMILGVLGGVALFGIFGFIVGPLTIILFIEIWKEYASEIKKK